MAASQHPRTASQHIAAGLRIRDRAVQTVSTSFVTLRAPCRSLLRRSTRLGILAGVSSPALKRGRSSAPPLCSRSLPKNRISRKRDGISFPSMQKNPLSMRILRSKNGILGVQCSETSNVVCLFTIVHVPSLSRLVAWASSSTARRESSEKGAPAATRKSVIVLTSWRVRVRGCALRSTDITSCVRVCALRA